MAEVRGHNVRSVLGQRGFRRLLVTRLFAQLADGLFQAGLAGSVLFNPQRAASPLAVAAGFAVLLLPHSLVGPYLGVLLDRWSRRRILVATNLLRAALLVPVIALIWHGVQGLGFLTLTLLIIGLGRFFLAAVSAAAPHVVEDRRLVTANAFSGTLGAISYSLGIGGVTLLVWLGMPATFHGYAAAAAIAPLGYLASALVAQRAFTLAELGPDVRCRRHVAVANAMAEVGREMVNGVRHLAQRRPAGYVLLAQSAHRVLYGVLALAMLLMFRGSFATENDLTGSVNGVGQAFIAGGLGTLLAALVTPAVARHIGGWRWTAILLGTAGVTVAVCGIPTAPALLPVAVGWISLVSQGTKIVVDTALQRQCDDAYRGRVFSVNDTLFNVCFVAGTYAGALVLPANGRSLTAVLGVTVGYLAIAAWYALVSSNPTGAARLTARVHLSDHEDGAAATTAGEQTIRTGRAAVT